MVRTCAVALLIVVSSFVFQCAGSRQLTKSEMDDLESDFYELLQARERQLKNSAYLVQVRVNAPDLKKKFNMEIYSEGDSVSFYSPGFLGKGTFKGIISGDSLRFYLPAEKAYYSGLWYELTEPDLGRWRDVFELVLYLLSGKMVPPGEENSAELPYRLEPADERNLLEGTTGNWKWKFLFDGDRFDMAVFGWIKDLLMVNFHIYNYSDQVPFFEFEKAYIFYSDRLQLTGQNSDQAVESEIRLTFIRQKSNIEIPPEKFELEIPPGAEKIYRLLPE